MAMEENMEMISSKKRKLFVELQNGESTEENSDQVLEAVTGFEGGVLVEKSLRSPDLEIVDFNSDGSETEISAMSMNGNFRREATSGIEVGEVETEQGLMYSSSLPLTPKKKSRPVSRRELPIEKMPSAAELEEFFAGAEKCEQKRFAEKYNYDIVKDVPLEGKYQWIRLHP